MSPAQMSEAKLAQYFTPQEIQSTEFTQPIIDMGNYLGLSRLSAHIGAITPRQNLSGTLACYPYRAALLADNTTK